MTDLVEFAPQNKKQGLAAGAIGVGVGMLTHSICCGALPIIMAGVARTGAAMGAHMHDGMSMGMTLGIGGLTTVVAATGLTYWQQYHTQTDKECAHTCLPHKAEQKKSGASRNASWGKIWAKNALIGAASFVAMQGIMEITDFNREKEMILAGRDTDRVLVVQESQAAWGLITPHRHYQSNHDLMDVRTDETGAKRVPLESITEEFGDAMHEKLEWIDVTETAAIDQTRMFGGTSQNVLKLN